MTVTPSGTASLAPNRVRALADAGLRRMALSIDGGSAAAHDEFRQECGSFERTLRAARATRVADLPLQITTTVCADTVGELPEIRELVTDLGAVLWSVFFLVPIGRGRALDPITPERAERVMEWLCTVADEASFGVKTTEAPHYRRVAMGRGDGAGALDRIVRRHPTTNVLASSPAFGTVRLATRSVPLVETPGVVDHHPLVTPPHDDWRRYYE